MTICDLDRRISKFEQQREDWVSEVLELPPDGGVVALMKLISERTNEKLKKARLATPSA